MSTVLVCGATGTVGSRVVHELRARGAATRVFVRDREKRSRCSRAISTWPSATSPIRTRSAPHSTVWTGSSLVCQRSAADGVRKQRARRGRRRRRATGGQAPGGGSAGRLAAGVLGLAWPDRAAAARVRVARGAAASSLRSRPRLAAACHRRGIVHVVERRASSYPVSTSTSASAAGIERSACTNCRVITAVTPDAHCAIRSWLASTGHGNRAARPPRCPAAARPAVTSAARSRRATRPQPGVPAAPPQVGAGIGIQYEVVGSLTCG